MIAIVVSRADSASERIFEGLLAAETWERRVDDARPDADGGGDVFRSDDFELRTFDDWHLELDDAAAAFTDTPDLLVFASRHAGDTGPLLTAHFTGNFGPAKYGGQDRSLAATCPNALSAVLDAFDEHAPLGYETGIECTHHGPTEVDVPSMFVELGSGEPQWDDDDAAFAVAESILALRGTVPHADRREIDVAWNTGHATDLRSSDDAPPRRHLVGIGGGHYAPRFERIVRETDWHVGHVAADWTLDELGSPERNRDVLDRAFERSDAEIALVADTDRDLDGVTRVVEELGYRVVSETWLRAVEDVPLELADRAESALSRVEDGLRFGTVPAEPVQFTVTDLPTALLDKAQGIAPRAVRQAVEQRTIAFETVENGNRVRGRAAFPASESGDPTGYDAMVGALADVLAEEYDSVERREDHVVAEGSGFDPALARDAGVSEGPAFGKLANGQPVTVDGRTITPEDVQSTRRETFPI